MNSSVVKIDYCYSSLIGAPIPYNLGDDEFRCPHCNGTMTGRQWINQAGDCKHCQNCWSDAFFRDSDGLLKKYNDPCLELLFNSVAEEMQNVDNNMTAQSNTHSTITNEVEINSLVGSAT